MNSLKDYSSLYPLMPIEICLFFQMQSEGGKLTEKTVIQFCNFYQKKYSTKDFPQPSVVAAICNILVSHNKLTLMQLRGPDGTNNSYLSIISNESLLANVEVQRLLNKKLSYLIYGFKFIYEDYRKFVLAIEFTDKDENKSLGTCFLYHDGIATARHCVEGAKQIAIQGISEETLQNSQFEIHDNPSMDLLFIRLNNKPPESIFFSKNGEVLDEIMTLGYPKIAGYHNFLTAENATVSSRFTASVGQVSSNAEDIWIREKLFLITAKIKGGNSGGPVIAKDGSIIGIAVNMSQGEGNYDDLGYGTVIPVSFLNELIDSKEKKYLIVRDVKFVNFEK